MRSLRRAVCVATMLVAMVVVAACGSSSRNSSSSSGATTTTAAAGGKTTAVATSGSCGTIPTQMPSDPDGVLAKLPASIRAAFNLYPSPVYASAWAHWKPKHPGPYTIYFNAGLDNTFAQEIVAELNKLKSVSKLVKNVIIQNDNSSVPTQVQQLQHAVAAKTGTVWIVFPLSSTADASLLEAAGKEGIPTITPLDSSPNKYIVGLNGNEPLQGAALTQGLAKITGGTGNLLEMQGLPANQATSAVLTGTADVLKQCPKFKVAGSAVGGYTESIAKTATLEFLAAHPQPVNAAIHVGGMATGIIQAFQQTGRTVPSIGDLGATPGALAYWNAHKSTYKGVALALPTVPLADAAWNLATGLLQGRGIKANEVLQRPVLITNANLSQWVQPGWTLTTSLGYAPGPPGVFYPPKYLNQFFSKP